MQDILEAISNIKDFTKDIAFDIYQGDFKTKHAIERNFSIIGEAVARIDKQFKDSHKDKARRKMRPKIIYSLIVYYAILCCFKAQDEYQSCAYASKNWQSLDYLRLVRNEAGQ